MENNVGKYYYSQDGGEPIRLRGIRQQDGTEQCIFQDPNQPLGHAAAKIYSVEETHKLTSIAPQLVAYRLEFKDAPIYDNLYIVIEPYSEEDENQLSVAIQVYEAMSSNKESQRGVLHIFAFHKHLDAVSYFRDMCNYQEAEVGPRTNLYYNDSYRFVMESTFRDWEDDLVYSLSYSRDRFREIRKMNPADTIGKTSLGNLPSFINIVMRRLLKMHTLKEDQVKRLTRFSENRLFTRLVASDLAGILNTETSISIYNSMYVDSDPVLQQTFSITPWNFRTDLARIKRDNPSYNMVLAKVEMEIPQVYVLLYRQKPVEFRESQQTGFSQEEMAKLIL
jgi:hypothetical protein